MTEERQHEGSITDRRPASAFAGNAFRLLERHPVLTSLSVVLIPSLMAALVGTVLSLGFLPGKTPGERMTNVELNQRLGDSLLHRRVDSVVIAIRQMDSVADERWTIDRPTMRAMAIDLCIRLSDNLIAQQLSDLRCEARFRGPARGTMVP